MDINQPEIKAFLFALYTQTGGDPEVQVSMHDIAGTLGIDETEAGSITESLYFQGLAELKSLSGGMGITAKGLKALDMRPPAGSPGYYSLPDKEFLDADDKKNILTSLDDIKKGMSGLRDNHDDLEQYVLDMKCIEFHLASPKSRTQIIRQLLLSIKDTFNKNNNLQINDSITALIS